MLSKTYSVLFLCTGNSARSILAEALATTLGGGKLIGYSAGSYPQGAVNPFALQIAKELGYSIDKCRSKSWNEYAKADAPQMDFIITVCDNAAGEVCPLWPGKPATAHWGFPDPASVTGSDEQKQKAFNEVAAGLKNYLNLLLALPIETMDNASIKAALLKIGQAH